MIKKHSKYFSFNRLVHYLILITLTGMNVACTETAPSSVNRTTAATSNQPIVTKRTIVEHFTQPAYNDKPMVRMWFPDAGSGLDPYNTIAEQIQSLAKAGFGGVEIAMLADGADFNNEQAKYIGWGTEAWKNVVKQVLIEANKIPTGFQVDLTFSPHWPLIINTIDPNDNAASQEIIHTVAEMQDVDLSQSHYPLLLPETKTTDTTSALESAPFIFTDSFISLALVKKVNPINKPKAKLYQLDSLIDLTEYVSIVSNSGYQAGIPDSNTCQQYDCNYQDVLTQWGEAPQADADLTASFNGKMDSQGNRARMQDWQNIYQVDWLNAKENIAALSGELSNYDLIATYRRGTGQVMSDGGFGGIAPLMYGRPYTVNYFDKQGIDAVTWFWDNKFLDDELRELLTANGQGSIFEDSIEAFAATQFWTKDILQHLNRLQFEHASKISTVIALGKDAFTDKALAQQLTKKYAALLGSLYETEHIEAAKSWAASLNYSYRTQARGITGVDEFSAASIVDIPEGDNGTKGDGIRTLAAAASMTDKSYVSMEAVTGFGNLQINWGDVITEVTQNFSNGINHVILHGSPYNKTWNGYTSDWPGWQAFGNNFAGSYSYRQVYWDDASTLSNYIARNQAVLRNGTAKIDVLSIGQGSSNKYQVLLDNGYAYHMASQKLLSLENATVEDNKLYLDGPSYKALIVDANTSVQETSHVASDGKPLGPTAVAKTLAFIDENAHTHASLDHDALKRVLFLAQQGLPVVFINYQQAYAANDSANLGLISQLTALENVYFIDEQAQLLTTLISANISASAFYETPQLEVTKYSDNTTADDFYYFYHNSYPTNKGMLKPGQYRKYQTATALQSKVTLSGAGKPFYLNTWTGEIQPIKQYRQVNEHSVQLTVNLFGGESIIIALLQDDTIAALSKQQASNNLPLSAWRFAKQRLQQGGATHQSVNLTSLPWLVIITKFRPWC